MICYNPDENNVHRNEVLNYIHDKLVMIKIKRAARKVHGVK